MADAVTHVLVNDPARGYGIFIENMLDAAAAVNFIASIIAAFSGNHATGALGLGGLFLVLGSFYSERAKKKNDKE